MSEIIDKHKIEHLIEHWIEHNNTHLKSFKDWSNKVRNAGHPDVATQILDAASSMEECNNKLNAAKDKLHG